GLKVSDDMLKKALADSISKSQVFSKVVEGAGGRYLLTVSIASLEQPLMGMSMTVNMETGWTLKRADTGATVCQEMVKTTHTATPSDAFVGVERLRLATEGCVRNNISTGLQKISQLNL